MNVAVRPRAVPRWVSFALDGRRCALPLEVVSRVVAAAEITRLPLAPAVVAGALDVGGSVLPVFDLRRVLRLPERALALDDQIIIARTARRPLALLVDQALGLIEAEPVGDTTPLAPHLRHLRGVLSTSEGLVLIQDLETFLTDEEEEALESALRAAEVQCKSTP